MNSNTKKRILIWILLITMLASLVSCGKKKEGTQWAPGVMMRIGESQIDVREGEIYLAAKLEDYGQYYGDDIWDYKIDAYGGTIGDFIRQQVLEEIVYIKIVCEKASEQNVVLTNDELLFVDEETAAFISRHPDKKYEESVVRKIYSDNFLARKLFEKSTLNIDTNISNDEAGQHHLYSIAIRNHKIGANGDRVEYSNAERSDLLGRMDAIAEAARTTEDFYKYAAGVTEEADSLEMYVGVGDLNSDFEKDILALKEGEISKVCEDKDYFYIFYCVSPMDIDATIAKKEEIIAERQREAFESYYSQWREEVEVEVNQAVWSQVK